MPRLTVNRTEELYERLEESAEGEVRMILDAFEFVKSPAHSNYNIYGPADILVKQWPDGDVDMHVALQGKAPAKPLPSGSR